MFYQESQLNEVLACEKCHERLDEPRNLPCGSILCSYCSKSFKIANNKFKCIICKKNHLIDDDGLPINKQLLSLLKKQPINVSRGKSFEKLDATLEQVDKCYQQLLQGVKNGSDLIIEYCSNLENEIQLDKEQYLLAIEDYYKKLSDQIHKYKQERVDQLQTNPHIKANFNKSLKELKAFHDKWSKYLSNNVVQDDLIEKTNTDGVLLVQKATKQKKNLDYLLFDNEHLVFVQKDKTLLIGALGILKGQIISSAILKYDQYVELMKLCSFSVDQTWNLIYRASRDGFQSNDFHSKCDNKKNTLVVIKSTNGNIFGGYTQQNWSGNQYKCDKNAFMFSLVNKENTPQLLARILESSSTIFCDPTNGPVFGAGHDLFICSKSNSINSSSSNLGSSFKHLNYDYNSNEARAFLAGSFNFTTIDIEVYTNE